MDAFNIESLKKEPWKIAVVVGIVIVLLIVVIVFFKFVFLPLLGLIIIGCLIYVGYRLYVWKFQSRSTDVETGRT